MEKIQSVTSKQLQSQISWLLLGFTSPKCKIRMNPIIVKFETEDSEIFFYLQANKLTCQFYRYTHTYTHTLYRQRPRGSRGKLYAGARKEQGLTL